MKKPALSFCSIFLVSILNPLVSHADFDEEEDLLSLYDDEELISIATGTEKQIRFAPSVASVISLEDIKNSGARTLDEALELVPGLHVARGANRLNAIYSIRGIHTAENPQVLLLIDGIDTSQLFTSARPFNFSLPIDNVERIEIIRGPGSAVYGADAFSGVINVITKTAQGSAKAEIGGRTGSFDTQDVWVATGKDINGLTVDFAVEYSKTDGDNDRVVEVDAGTTLGIGSTEAPGQLNTDSELFNSRFGIGTENWKLSIHSWSLVDAGLGSGGAEALDPTGSDESDSVSVAYKHKFRLADHWKLHVSLASSYLKQEPNFVLYAPGATAPAFFGPGVFADGVIGRPHSEESKHASEFAVFFDGFSDHDIRLAVGYEYNDIELTEEKNFDFFGRITAGDLTDVSGTNLIFLEDQTRELYYVSLQNEWHIADDWELTVGLRFDEYNDFGSTVNPRIALVWAADYNFTMKALYGRAFRAPSFAELFAQNNPAILGNPNLDPEIIDTFEIALDYQFFSKLGAKVNIFYYEIDDLIDFPAFGAPAENLFSQYGYGFESELDWEISESIELSANFSWQQAQQSSRAVSDAPGHQAFARLIWEPADFWTIATSVHYIADRERAATDLRSDIDDYVKTDIVVRRKKLFDHLEVGLVAHNLFNADVREPSDGQIPSDYPLEGRSVRLEVIYNLTD